MVASVVIMLALFGHYVRIQANKLSNTLDYIRNKRWAPDYISNKRWAPAYIANKGWTPVYIPNRFVTPYYISNKGWSPAYIPNRGVALLPLLSWHQNSARNHTAARVMPILRKYHCSIKKPYYCNSRIHIKPGIIFL